MHVWKSDGATDTPIASADMRVFHNSASSAIVRNVPNNSTNRCCDGVGNVHTTLQHPRSSQSSIVSIVNTMHIERDPVLFHSYSRMLSRFAERGQFP